jgi:hypothetical protein
MSRAASEEASPTMSRAVFEEATPSYLDVKPSVRRPSAAGALTGESVNWNSVAAP